MTSASPRTRTIAHRAILVAALIAAMTRPAESQAAIYGAGLQAWLGCWSPDLPTFREEVSPSIVCITPTASVNVADVLTVQGGRIVSRETLDATGVRRAITAERCTGERSASWSRDGRRLFVRSSGRCAGVPSSTSGLLAITPEGDWLDVEGISAGGGARVRVARYREVAPPTALPATVRSTLRAQSLATQSVRVSAGTAVRAEDVLEAARTVDSAVVEAWLLERANRFELTVGEMGALLRAGVPSRIADALAAVAEPDAYDLARRDRDGTNGLQATSYDLAYGLPLGWGWGWGYPLARGSRYGGGYRDAWRYGHYRPPVAIVHRLGIVRHGRERYGDDRRRPARDDRGGMSGDPRRAAPTATPPAGDPRRAPARSGGSIRLGKP